MSAAAHDIIHHVVFVSDATEDIPNHFGLFRFANFLITKVSFIRRRRSVATKVSTTTTRIQHHIPVVTTIIITLIKSRFQLSF